MNNGNLSERVDFEIIRYANCWEDTEILLQGLSPEKGGKILSIGSAGDNSFSLLLADPELVIAVDINKIQLFLIELKKICILRLEHAETLAFLGFLPSENRLKMFDFLKMELSPEARNYWETNVQQIRDGIIHQGKFEKYFQLFSRKILPWIHDQKTVNELLAVKTGQEQQKFYENNWNTWRWKLLFRIFFSKYVMGKYGRDPEFLKQVSGSVSRFIFDKSARHLVSEAAQDNYILRYCLTGTFDSLLPHYLQQKNYEKIRLNLGRLHLQAGFAQGAIGKFGKFDCMNLSDIFEYMDENLFVETARALVNGTEKDGRLAYWNLMVNRKISQVLPEKVEYCRNVSESLTAIDKGFFYKEFVVDRVTDRIL